MQVDLTGIHWYGKYDLFNGIIKRWNGPEVLEKTVSAKIFDVKELPGAEFTYLINPRIAHEVSLRSYARIVGLLRRVSLPARVTEDGFER